MSSRNHEHHSVDNAMGDQQQSTQEKTHHAVESAKSQGEHVVSEAQVRGDQARKQVESKAEEQKNRAADHIDKAADKVRDKGQQLPGGDTTRQMAGMAANKMGQVADYLHQTNTDDMLAKVREFTRQHPMQALMGAAFVGLYLGRKLFS